MFSQRFQKPNPDEITDQKWWGDVTSDNDEKKSWEALVEGQLMVDVYDRPDAIVVRSLIAGVNAEDLDISLNDDMLTLRGIRNEHEEVADDQFYHRECYWGTFSRTIIMPTPVRQEKIKAFSKNGVVVIILPKATSAQGGISIRTEDEFLEYEQDDQE
ncbi:MAG: Hsp20/alpha crystallin family protein [bacterium]|nr:Hsp20/alpha crystallin family protein [bacterium]